MSLTVMCSFFISRTSGTSRLPFRFGPSESVLTSRRWNAFPGYAIRDMKRDTIRPVRSVMDKCSTDSTLNCHTERTGWCVGLWLVTTEHTKHTATPTGHPEPPVVGSGSSEPPAVGSEHTSLSSSEIGVASMPISLAAGTGQAEEPGEVSSFKPSALALGSCEDAAGVTVRCTWPWPWHCHIGQDAAAERTETMRGGQHPPGSRRRRQLCTSKR